jgi:hypothetical protein
MTDIKERFIREWRSGWIPGLIACLIAAEVTDRLIARYRHKVSSLGWYGPEEDCG